MGLSSEHLSKALPELNNNNRKGNVLLLMKLPSDGHTENVLLLMRLSSHGHRKCFVTNEVVKP